MKKILFIIVMTLGLSGYAQVGVGTSSPDASAQLDVTAANKGILIPRVKLTGSADAVTVPSPKESLLVYNTETAGDVVPGFYYWNAVKWTALAGGGGAVGNIAIANGGTGATTAAAALTNLGAQSVANLTTVLGNLTDHYPSESAVKTYVDAMPSFYRADGMLTMTREVNQMDNDLIFNTGAGKFVVNGNTLHNGAVFGKITKTKDPTYVLQPDDYIIMYNGSSDANFYLGEATDGRVVTLMNNSRFAFTIEGLSPASGVQTVASYNPVSFIYDGTDWFSLNQ